MLQRKRPNLFCVRPLNFHVSERNSQFSIGVCYQLTKQTEKGGGVGTVHLGKSAISSFHRLPKKKNKLFFSLSFFFFFFFFFFLVVSCQGPLTPCTVALSLFALASTITRSGSGGSLFHRATRVIQVKSGGGKLGFDHCLQLATTRTTRT